MKNGSQSRDAINRIKFLSTWTGHPRFESENKRTGVGRLVFRIRKASGVRFVVFSLLAWDTTVVGPATTPVKL